jgi:hypothetical protein
MRNLTDDENPLDRNGILKDGHTVHVRFRDAVRARDQDNDDDDDDPPRRGRRRVTAHDPFGRIVAEYSEDAMRADPNRVYGSSGAVVAARPGFIGTAASQRIRDEAYQQSKRDMQDAWKSDAPPVCKPTSTDSRPHNPQQPISMADAQRIRDTAYQQMCDEMQNAWRRP